MSTSTEISKADALRALADFIDANPDLPDLVTDQRLLTYVSPLNKPRAVMAAVARAGAKAGVPVEKSYDGGEYANLSLQFGPIELHVYAQRDAVCERVVTGTREVTKEVPDPEALAAVPTVTVTETEDIVEWVCGPLLATDQVPA
ncbi:MAG: hypothetical protein JWM40_2943 [Frankiales bacterium]|nr:hypothetical protein [Frankiales bacterium]